MNDNKHNEANAAADFSFGDIGFLDAIFDTDMLMSLGAAAAGGGGAGLAYGVILDKVDWFSTGSDNVRLAKQTGLGLAIGVAAGAALWQVSEHAASGAMGAMGAVLASNIANRVGLKAPLGKQVVEVKETKAVEAPKSTEGLRGTVIRRELPDFRGTNVRPLDPRMAMAGIAY